MKRVRTGCPYCGVGCGLVAEVDNGRLESVKGDPLHPVNRGATCRKPLRLPDAVSSPDRATTPLVRASPDERWDETTWRSVVPMLARRLGRLVEEHGPDSVAFYVSGQLLTEDYYAVTKLAKGFLGTNNVDSNSRLCMSSAVAGYREALGSDGPPGAYADIAETDCMLLLGSNTSACHPILWAKIRRRQKEGAQVIVIDPRRTDTAAAADLHLPVRPGGDLALLNGMLHVLARDGLVDERFLARHAEGAEAALAAAEAWTPERAAAASGVDADLIVDAARRFGRAKRAMALWSMGANQSSEGTLKNRALHNLCLATGNIGRPGTGPLSLTGQPNAMGGREVGGLAQLLPGYRSVGSAEDRAEMRRLWDLPPTARGISPQAGLASTELVDALEDGRVKAVWIVATNPLVSQPDAERFEAALRRAELVVVQDAYHPTETAALAHVALPAAQWPEKEGTMTSSERRVTLLQKAVAPPGSALPDWEIFARVGRALGHAEAFAWRTAAEVFDEFRATTAGRLCDMTGMSHARLREGSLQWPCPARGPDGDGHDGTVRLYRSLRFPTPNGRARLAPTPHTGPAEQPDEAFPLILTTGRVAGQWHTMTRTAKSQELLDADPEPFVELHPDDASRNGIEEGDRVRVVSRRGSAVLRARVTDRICAGTAFAPFHWGALHLPPGAGALNAVTNNALDPVSKQAELKACAVRVEPAPLDPVRVGGRARRRVLVVGGGVAAQATAEAALAHDPDGLAITVVGAEQQGPYNRVLLSSLVAGGLAERDLALQPDSWFDTHDVTLRRGVRVASVDLAERVASLDDGSEEAFDALVLATGSQPAMPPIDGLHRDGVHAFRTLADARAIVARALTARRAVVIGGGLLGLEAARGLAGRGLDVTVVHLADRLMELQLDRIGADMLERQVRGLGIDVLAGRSTSAVLGNGKVEAVALDGGEELDADLVVVATGVRPDVGLARAAGLECDRGVLVDDGLRASAPSVWAVGECAQHRGRTYGLVGPAVEQARVAGAALAERPAAFLGAVAATTLKVAGVDLFCAGEPDARDGDEEVLALDTRAGRYRRLVLRDGRLAGAVLLGDLSQAPLLRELLASGRRVPEHLLGGELPAAPAEELLCSCAAVPLKTVKQAIADGGLRTVDAVGEATQAGTGCGGCRPRIAELVAG